MRVLVDTHVLIWWLEDARRLSRRAETILASLANEILVSAVVGWEIAIKVGVGKMEPQSLIQGLERVLDQQSFSELPITLDAAVRAGLLPTYHRDPFDRMLAAQAQLLSVPVLSADAIFDRYGVKRIW